MEKISLWLSNISAAVLTFFSLFASANMENSVTLKINFEKYAIPHTTFVINGHPVYAAIDTGSSFGFHLQDPQLKKIKGLKKQRSWSSTDAAGKIQQHTEYLADSLDVNGLKHKKCLTDAV